MPLKVMAVDDEPEVLKFLQKILEPREVEVLTMSDSRQAAERLERERFDAVLLDVMMPHLDGFGLTRRIRNSPFNMSTPIVMVTAYDDANTMREGFKAGITFFLGKPIDPSKVRGLLNVTRGAILREKRRHARLPFRTTVDCRFGELHFKAMSLNLGANGMALEPSGGLESGQALEVEFLLPEAEHSVKQLARVVRNEMPDRIAVEFVDLSPANKEALRNYFSGLIKT